MTTDRSNNAGSIPISSASSAMVHATESNTVVHSTQFSSTSAQPSLGVPRRQRAFRKSAITASVIAQRIIEFCQEHGDVVTNLRLQKLLYYAQAWYLAVHGEPLFTDKFEAWPNGPIQPEVFAEFRTFGSGPIQCEATNIKLPKQVEEHIKDLFQSYGRLSGFEIEQLSREEEPWRESRIGLAYDEASRNQISEKTMKRYYKSKLHGKTK